MLNAPVGNAADDHSAAEVSAPMTPPRLASVSIVATRLAEALATTNIIYIALMSSAGPQLRRR